ncbi:MAG: hypothetical protein ACRDT1_06100, partial [Micromonosporaceae bacterium]
DERDQAVREGDRRRRGGGLGALGTALADGAVTPVEWVGVALATVTALGVVLRVPNTPKPAAE